MGRARTESLCKVNLFLRVTGRRADGFHTLETVFFPLGSPSDTLEADFDAAPGIALEADLPGVPAGPENLVCRAAARYAETAELTPRWRFRLTKRVPVAAGLGGGSADAAAALRLLEEHFGALGKAALAQIAAELGADVPFFLESRPALARGIGGELEPVTLAAGLPLVLVNPGFPVSAKWAYRQFDLGGAEESDASCGELLAGLARGDWKLAARHVRNDLAGALWRKFPVLTRIADELAARGALTVEVSGSGPTLFAVMPSVLSARRAAANMSERFPQWRSFAAEGR